MKSPITTHVLDTAAGRPAAGVPVRLDIEDSSGHWDVLATGITDDDGRVMDLLPSGHKLVKGTYRMRFGTDEYFHAIKTEGFYPFADIVFSVVKTDEHFHIPLLLSPFGYSTYRGS